MAQIIIAQQRHFVYFAYLLLVLQLVAAFSFAVGIEKRPLTELTPSDIAYMESLRLAIVSEEDAKNMEYIKYHMEKGYTEFKSIHEVHAFLDKLKLLVQKHPKNVAFARDLLGNMQQFLSQESVTKLIRVDTDLFVLPITDEKIPLALKAVEEDELTRKLFGGPLRSLIEARKQELSNIEPGNHKDTTNFFSNFWCKLSGNCHQ